MRIETDPRLPQVGSIDYDRNFRTRLYDLFRKLAQQINGVTEGQISAVTNATTAAPTSGTYQVGDFVRNSAPSELGSAGSKYIVTGWTCIATPNTFVQTRALTGN